MVSRLLLRREWGDRVATPPRPGQVRLNHAGIAKLLKSAEFREMTNREARALGEAAGGSSKGVKVDEYTTDRSAASVKVPAARQAKSGALTRAASSRGLEVRQKP